MTCLVINWFYIKVATVKLDTSLDTETVQIERVVFKVVMIDKINEIDKYERIALS